MMPTKQAQLCSGTTLKGNPVAFTTSITQRTISNTGTWTREELNDIKINLNAVRGSQNTGTALYIYFYGADLTINYTIPGDKYYTYTISNISSDHNIIVTSEGLYLKVNGEFKRCNKIYKKINNAWTEVSLDTLTDSGIYIKK